MAFMPLVIAGGMAEAYNEDVAEKKAQVAAINAVKREWLFKTGMENIQKRRESLTASKARIAEAKRFGFSNKAAKALEMSGQLEFEVGKVQTLIKNNKLSENYIPTLTAFLEGKVDNDEDLAAALAKGLQGDSFVSEEDQSLGLINSIGDLNELQEQFLKTTKSTGRTGLPAFQYTQTKGARIELSDRKSIQAQLANSLNTIHADSFTVTNTGEVVFNQNAKPEVQALYNDLVDRTIDLAEDPTNTFSPVSALTTVISAVEKSSNVPATTVLEKLDEAITTPNFNWTPFKSTSPQIVNPPIGGPTTGLPTDDLG